MPQIPEGLCQCGCGMKTNLHPWAVARLGILKGQPYKYVTGHNNVREPGPAYRVDPNTGCWIWARNKSLDGYGLIRRSGKQQTAHRLFYERAFGQVPAGYELDHLCQNRSCVNPDHMEPVTHAENCRRSSTVKLDRRKAQMIRELSGQMTGKDIAVLFGVHKSTVNQIIRREIWAV